MTDLAAFLSARLDEDEAVALESAQFPSEWRAEPGYTGQPIMAGNYRVATCALSVMAHIARHDPARVLADVAAKRAMLAHLLRCHTTRFPRDQAKTADDFTPLAWDMFRYFAAAYADHPDFDSSWRL